MMPHVTYLLVPTSKLPLKVIPIMELHLVLLSLLLVLLKVRYVCGGMIS